MISEEIFRIKILRFVPEDVIPKFFTEKIETYKGGFALGKEFEYFLSCLNSTIFAKKIETTYRYDKAILESALRHIILKNNEFKSVQFVVGFIRFVMLGKNESFKRVLLNPKVITEWFKINGSWMNTMIMDEKFDDWLKDMEKE